MQEDRRGSKEVRELVKVRNKAGKTHGIVDGIIVACMVVNINRDRLERIGLLSQTVQQRVVLPIPNQQTSQ